MIPEYGKGELQLPRPLRECDVHSKSVRTPGQMRHVCVVNLLPRDRRQSCLIHHPVASIDNAFRNVVLLQSAIKRERIIMVVRVLICHATHPRLWSAQVLPGHAPGQLKCQSRVCSRSQSFNSAIGTRDCSMESRLRMVTHWSSVD